MSLHRTFSRLGFLARSQMRPTRFSRRHRSSFLVSSSAVSSSPGGSSSLSSSPDGSSPVSSLPGGSSSGGSSSLSSSPDGSSPVSSSAVSSSPGGSSPVSSSPVSSLPGGSSPASSLPGGSSSGGSSSLSSSPDGSSPVSSSPGGSSPVSSSPVSSLPGGSSPASSLPGGSSSGGSSSLSSSPDGSSPVSSSPVSSSPMSSSFVSSSPMSSSSVSSGRYYRVLGIESSCDDTGAAVVDSDGRILGEALHSQTQFHVEMGGVMPFVAQDMHAAHIDGVVMAALRNAQMEVSDVDAIACTNRPGLVMSLRVGLNYAKKLVEKYNKPLIPIHHMKAHALTARMIHKVEFPFLVLLVSGGHSLLTLAQSVDDFLILGKSRDIAPGDAFDKTARALKLKNLPECYGLSGGASVELMAQGGDPKSFEITYVMSQQADCNFSFTGLLAHYMRLIRMEEAERNIVGSAVLPNVSDICANFQYAVLTHMAKRVQRGLLYCEMHDLLPEQGRVLVISGGVGSNQFLRKGVARVCAEYDCEVVCPPPKLCTDNGIMIAWNGVEKLRAGAQVHSKVAQNSKAAQVDEGVMPNSAVVQDCEVVPDPQGTVPGSVVTPDCGFAPDPQAVGVMPRSDIGRDVTQNVAQCGIRAKTIKLL